MKPAPDERNPKAHLGVGWSFPVKPVGGALRWARYEEDIEQAIQIVLLTAQGERVMLPDFGAGTRDLVFEPNSPATRSRITELVRRALTDWEPRIRLERVEAVADRDVPERILVHVDYVVEVTNEAYNRVYPFYLLEGRG